MTSNKSDSIIPNEREVEIALESIRALAPMVNKKLDTFNVTINENKEAVKISIPANAFKMLFSILTQMSQGNAMMMIPVHAELTTQEAANLLNVSRPFLVNLLEENKIPYRKVGTRRKILFQDILTYKDSMYKARLKTLDTLTKESQDLDMGY